MTTSRRRVLRALAAGAGGALAGCGSLSMSGSGDEDVPAGAPSAWMPHPDRIDGVSGTEFTGWGLRTAPFRADDLASNLPSYLDRRGEFLGVDPGSVEALVVGGSTRLNSFPRAQFSLVGLYLFEVVEGSFDAADVEEAVGGHDDFEAAGDRGGFSLFDGERTTVAVSEGEVVHGFSGPTREVIDARGEDESDRFVEDVELVVDHLEPGDATMVRGHERADRQPGAKYFTHLQGQVAAGQAFDLREDAMDFQIVRAFADESDVDRDRVESVTRSSDRITDVDVTVDGRVAVSTGTVTERDVTDPWVFALASRP